MAVTYPIREVSLFSQKVRVAHRHYFVLSVGHNGVLIGVCTSTDCPATISYDEILRRINLREQ